MNETTEEAEKKGSWICLSCRRPVNIVDVIRVDDTYELVSDCPEKHSITFKVQDNGGVAYLTYEEQKEMAKIFLATVLVKLEESTKEDMLTINATKAMAGVSGLTEDECGNIVKQGIENEWVDETQSLILDRIKQGDKQILIDEVIIDDTKEPETESE